MANEVEIKVTSKNLAKPGLADAGRDFDAFAKTGVRAGDAVAASIQRLTDKAQAATLNVQKATAIQANAFDQVQLAHAKVAAATAKSTAAGEKDVNATLNLAAAKTELGGRLRALALSEMQAAEAHRKASRAWAEVDVAHQAGQGLADQVGDQATKAGKEIGPKLAGAGGASIAAAGPALAAAGAAAMAMVGGALIAGAGAGIAGMGLKIAAGRGEVRGSIEKLGSDITSDMQVITRPFTATWAHILDQGRRTFAEFRPTLAAAMEELAPDLSRFVGEAGRAMRQFEPAIKPVQRAFSAILDDLGPRLPMVIGGIEKSMSRLAGAVEENPQALGDLIELGGEAAETLLNLAAGATAVYDAWQKFVDIVTFGVGGTDEATAATGELADVQLQARQSAEEVAEAQKQAAEAAEDYAKQIEMLTEAVYRNIGGEIARKEAIDASDDALAEYNEAVKKHGRDSEEASDALLGVESAALRVAEATLSAAYAQQDANGQARDTIGANNAARAALMDMAAHAKGPARDAILAQADALLVLSARLRAVSGDFYARVHVSTSGQAPRFALGAMQSFAHGGVVGAAGGGPRSRQTLVGEHGPEIVDLAPGSMVHPAGETQRMLADMAGGAAGGGGPPLYELRLSGSRLWDVLIQELQREIRDRGGLGRVFVQ